MFACLFPIRLRFLEASLSCSSPYAQHLAQCPADQQWMTVEGAGGERKNEVRSCAGLDIRGGHKVDVVVNYKCVTLAQCLSHLWKGLMMPAIQNLTGVLVVGMIGNHLGRKSHRKAHQSVKKSANLSIITQFILHSWRPLRQSRGLGKVLPLWVMSRKQGHRKICCSVFLEPLHSVGGYHGKTTVLFNINRNGGCLL